ncbi:hypothetical protein BN175_190087 [Clostridioides difficile T23]|nr:hypothetical protein BN173_1580003 [Clostridioides difficile T11]CCL29768.1 hypothetical protein BN174_1500003 [Clostridioides difficile E15]CCL35055.1 hypothetical protein BN175_190087 [Clostridioides difficile T23]CCL37542.1 hypothetical protein BN176_1460003 [Clostridioides difficile E19]
MCNNTDNSDFYFETSIFLNNGLRPTKKVIQIFILKHFLLI